MSLGSPCANCIGFAAQARTDTPLIVIEAPDETHIVDLFGPGLLDDFMAMHRRSITERLRRFDLNRQVPHEVAPGAISTLRVIQQADQHCVHLLLDFCPCVGYAATQTQLREIEQAVM